MCFAHTNAHHDRQSPRIGARETDLAAHDARICFSESGIGGEKVTP
jgi:hypothetical protein